MAEGQAITIAVATPLNLHSQIYRQWKINCLTSLFYRFFLSFIASVFFVWIITHSL